MINVRVVSDIHLDNFASISTPHVTILDFLSRVIPHKPEDDVLVLAGDLCSIRSGLLGIALRGLLTRFNHVIYVLGNHEHYGSMIGQTLTEVHRQVAEHIPAELAIKLTVAGNDVLQKKIRGMTFIAGTLWTDCGSLLPDKVAVKDTIQHFMNDYRSISVSPGIKFTVGDTITLHRKAVKAIDELLTKRGGSTVVVVTHHLPSFSGVDPYYLTSPHKSYRDLNHAFASNLDELILRHQPAFWVFGHTHTPVNVKLGATQLICNPHGYPNEKQHVPFNPTCSFNL